MITKRQYVEYLVSTPKNCICTSLAEHLEDVSHDVVNDFLRQKRFMPREIWKLGKDRIKDSTDAGLIVDDSVHDKRYARFIDLVRAQYSGNEHRVVRGSGVVSLVHRAGKDGDFYPIDYRGYAPEVEGKSKHEHFHEMFVNAVVQKELQARSSAVVVGFGTNPSPLANWMMMDLVGTLLSGFRKTTEGSKRKVRRREAVLVSSFAERVTPVVQGTCRFIRSSSFLCFSFRTLILTRQGGLYSPCSVCRLTV